MKSNGSQSSKKRPFVSLTWVQVIRQGLVSVIPVLLIGAFSLALKSLPIIIYQKIIQNWLSGIIFKLLDGIYHVSFGLLSIYMTLTIGYHYAVMKRSSSSACIGCPLVSVAAFMILTGVDNLTIDTLGPKGMFLAIISALLASYIFCTVLAKQNTVGFMANGADVHLCNTMLFIKPMLAALILFAFANQLLMIFSGGQNAHQLLQIGAGWLFSLTGDGFVSGLLFVVLSSVLWFFGIHGSDILEGASSSLFAPNVEVNSAMAAAGMHPTIILTKQFFDVFVLMGGCGSAMCLLLALLLFSRRHSNQRLARMAAFPMLFNINEIMIFGLPVIYNPAMMIPFLCTPVVCFITSYSAMRLGIVPVVTASVEWTTPIFWGGYLATGSIAGVILQMVNLMLGVLIYRPFVMKYDQEMLRSSQEYYDRIVSIVKESEATRTPVTLTQLPGGDGTFVKALSADLMTVVKNGEICLHYQPQYRLDGSCLGAEALLRWNHPILGMIYPPLLLKLADENGLLEQLEQLVVSKTINDANTLWDNTKQPLKISVNVTGTSIQNPDFEAFLLKAVQNVENSICICLELTEQTALQFDDKLQNRLIRLRNAGYHLAIDDFSMGSTSIKYLQGNYFDMVKLDGALVKKSLINPRNKEIISSIISLSHSLGFEVMAEYISTEELRDCMAELGCTLYQGWLYAPALELKKLEERLKGENITAMQKSKGKMPEEAKMK